jgi:hypothetical protein
MSGINYFPGLIEGYPGKVKIHINLEAQGKQVKDKKYQYPQPGTKKEKESTEDDTYRQKNIY